MDTTPAPAGFPAVVKEQEGAEFAPPSPSLAPFAASSAFPTATQPLGGAAATVPGAALAPHPAAATTAVSPVVKQELGTAQTLPSLFAPQPGLSSSATTSAPGYKLPPLASFRLENVAQDLRLEAERRMNQGPASKRPRLVVHSGADTKVNDFLSELNKATRRIAAAANRNFHPRRQGQQLRPGAMQAISRTVDELQRQVAAAKQQQNAGASRRRRNRRQRKQRVDDKIMAGLRARLGRLSPQKRSEAYLRIQEALHKVEFGSTSE